MSDGVLTASDTFEVTVNAVNDAPTLSTFTNQSINEDGETEWLSFTVADLESSASSLMVSATSSHPTLVSSANIAFEGTEGSRTLRIKPTANQHGTATITVAVSDGTLTTQQSFQLTVASVNDLPTISALSDQTFAEDGSIVLALTVQDLETPASSLIVTATSADTSLIHADGLVFSGTGTSRTLQVKPVAHAAGTTTITVTVNDGISTATETFEVTVTPVNDAPTLSAISTQTVAQGAATGALAFTIGDIDTSVGSLVVTATSLNTTLVPNTGIALGDSGTNRTITITPDDDYVGSAMIVVTVSDGTLSTSKSFTVNVTATNAALTISDIPPQTTEPGESTGAISFELGGTNAASPTVTIFATSSNPSLVPFGNIVLGGTGANRTVTVTPVSNVSGTAIISLTASDGGHAAVDTFTLTVEAVNEVPTLSAFTDKTLQEDGATGKIFFSVNDAETSPVMLVVTATSSNPTLLPASSILLGGFGASRTLELKPAANEWGNALVSITVSDGVHSETNTFELTVAAVNDLPTIGNIGNVTIPEDSDTGEISFVVSDIETLPGELTVTATSSNTTLFPNNSLVLAGSGQDRTIKATPAANATGSAVVTVSVNDGTSTSTKTFTVTVGNVNDTPTLGDFMVGSNIISGITVDEDAPVDMLTFAIADPETAASSLQVTVTSSDTTLVPATGLVLGNSGANRTLKIVPAANQFGCTTITVTVSDGALSVSKSLVLTVNAVNDVPTISNIFDQTTAEDLATGEIAFVIGDIDSPANSLSVTATSANGTLVPEGNITLGGSGVNRTIKILPAENQFGSSIVTVTVSDGVSSSSDTFQLTVTAVNDAPTISEFSTQVTDEDVPLSSIPFTIGDVETLASALTVSATVSDTAIFPPGSITISGEGADRTLSLTPAANNYGSVLVTIVVNDGSKIANRTFVVNVRAVDDAPTIADLADVSVDEDAEVLAIPFTVGDVETAATSLIVTATSSDGTLVTPANISVSGSGANRTLNILPSANLSGSAVITVSVSDGKQTTTDTFVLTVNAVNDPPTLSSIESITIEEDEESPLRLFTIGDTETPVEFLTVFVHSSNGTLLPEGSISITGSGAQRALALIPAENETGTSTITVTVSDGTDITEYILAFTVSAINDAPTIGAIEPQTTSEDVAISDLAFTIGDAETAASQLVVTVSSSNTALLPTSGLTLGGTGAERTISISPATGKSGIAVVTLTVGDGLLTTTESFVVQVTPVGEVTDAPSITFIGAQSIEEDAALQDVEFTIGDAETDVEELTLTAHSSDGTLIPSENIQFSGTGATRVLTITPAAHQAGASTITIIVTDEDGNSAASVFTLYVSEVNDLPTMTAITDQSVLEDGTSEPIPLTVSDVETGTGGLVVLISSSNEEILPASHVQVLGSGAQRSLLITPFADQFGSVDITVKVRDGHWGEVSQTFTVDVQAVNDAPSFYAYGDLYVTALHGVISIAAWASEIHAGPANENGQELEFIVTTDTPSLFAELPTVSAEGTLSFVPAPHAVGTAQVTVKLADDGGDENGGADISSEFTFKIQFITPEIFVNGVLMTDQESAFDFGSVPVGGSITKTITIQNPSWITLDLLPEFALPAGFYLAAPLTSQTISPSQPFSFDVVFEPAMAGVFRGPIELANGTEADPAFNFQVVARATLQPSSIRIYDEEDVELVSGESNLVFAAASPETPVTRTLKIQNGGGAQLLLDTNRLTLPPGYSVVGLPGLAIDPGEFTTLTIQRTGTVLWELQGGMSIASNDPELPNFAISLSSTSSVAPGKAEFEWNGQRLAGSANTVTFSTATPSFPTTRTIIVRNTGGADLNIGVPSVPAGFEIVPSSEGGSDFPQTIAPGRMGSIVLRLTATMADNWEGEVTVPNAEGSAVVGSFEVSGDTEVSAKLTITSGTHVIAGEGGDYLLNFGDQLYVGDTVSQTLLLRNWGGTAVLVDADVDSSTLRVTGEMLTSELFPLLGPDESLEIVITIDTSSADNINGAITVYTDADDFVIQLSGRVRAAKPIAPDWPEPPTEQYDGPPAPIEVLELDEDDGSSSTDNITSNPTIVGQVTAPHDSLTEPLAIEFDYDGDELADEETVTDSAGYFTFLPTLPKPGSYEVQARSRRFNFATKEEVFSEWFSISFTYEAALPPRVQNLHLVNDTGVSAADRVTDDPTIAGDLGELESEDPVALEFDWTNDGIPDAYVMSQSGGEFETRPVGIPAGNVELRARSRVWNTALGDYKFGDWTSLHFTFDPPVNPAVEANTGIVYLQRGTPAAQGSGWQTYFEATSDATLYGGINDGENVRYLSAEFEVNGDGVVDDEVELNGSNQFVHLPRMPLAAGSGDPTRMTPGTWTISTRFRGVDIATGQDVYSPWTLTTFQYVEPTNRPPVISTFGNVQTAGDGRTASMAFNGQVTNDGNPGELLVEFDHNGDGVADGITFTLEDGSFGYQPVALPLGYQTMRARVHEWDAAINAHDRSPGMLSSEWSDVDFVLLPPEESFPSLANFHVETSGGLAEVAAGTPFQMTITGNLVWTNVPYFTTVQIDIDADGVIEAEVAPGQDGSFSYVTSVMPSGSVAARVSAITGGGVAGSSSLQWETGDWMVVGVNGCQRSESGVSCELVSPPDEDEPGTPSGASSWLLETMNFGNSQGISTSSDTLWGQITALSNENATDPAEFSIEFDVDGDGIADETAAVDGAGDFGFTPSNLSNGFGTIAARIVGNNSGGPANTAWTAVSFVQADDANSAEAADLVGALNTIHPQWRDKYEVLDPLTVAGLEGAQSTALAQAGNAYEKALKAAAAARDAAFINAFVSARNSMLAAKSADNGDLVNAKAALVASMQNGSIDPNYRPYPDTLFQMPEAPPDGGLLIPDDATQAGAPALPSYEGAQFQYETDPWYIARAAGISEKWLKARDRVGSDYDKALQKAAENLSKAQADAARKAAALVDEAQSKYEETINAPHPTIDFQAEIAALEETLATLYADRAAALAELESTYQETRAEVESEYTIEMASLSSAYRDAVLADPSNNEVYVTAMTAFILGSADAENVRSLALADATKQFQDDSADAEFEYQQNWKETTHEKETLVATHDRDLSIRNSNAYQDRGVAESAAAKFKSDREAAAQRRKAFAEADAQFAKMIATARYETELAIAQATARRDSTVRQASANPTPWAIYQRELAIKSLAYVNSAAPAYMTLTTASATQTRDQARREALATEAKSVADRLLIHNNTQDEATQTKARENGLAEIGFTRVQTERDSILERDLAIATLEHTKSLEYAQALATYEAEVAAANLAFGIARAAASANNFMDDVAAENHVYAVQLADLKQREANLNSSQTYEIGQENERAEADTEIATAEKVKRHDTATFQATFARDAATRRATFDEQLAFKKLDELKTLAASDKTFVDAVAAAQKIFSVNTDGFAATQQTGVAGKLREYLNAKSARFFEDTQLWDEAEETPFSEKKFQEAGAEKERVTGIASTFVDYTGDVVSAGSAFVEGAATGRKSYFTSEAEAAKTFTDNAALGEKTYATDTKNAKEKYEHAQANAVRDDEYRRAEADETKANDDRESARVAALAFNATHYDTVIRSLQSERTLVQTLHPAKLTHIAAVLDAVSRCCLPDAGKTYDWYQMNDAIQDANAAYEAVYSPAYAAHNSRVSGYDAEHREAVNELYRTQRQAEFDHVFEQTNSYAESEYLLAQETTTAVTTFATDRKENNEALVTATGTATKTWSSSSATNDSNLIKAANSVTATLDGTVSKRSGPLAVSLDGISSGYREKMVDSQGDYETELQKRNAEARRDYVQATLPAGQTLHAADGSPESIEFRSATNPKAAVDNFQNVSAQLNYRQIKEVAGDVNTLQQDLSDASGVLVSSVSTTIGGDADALKDNRITYGNNAADGDKNWITKWSETMVDGSASGSKADDKWAEKNVEVEADYVLAQAQADWEQKLRNAVIDRDYQYLQLEEWSAAQWRHDERQYAIDMEQSRALHLEAMNAARLARVTDLGTAGQTWSSDWGDTRIAQTAGLNSGDSAYVGALNTMESGWATGEAARETTLVAGLGSSATAMFGSVGEAAAGFQAGLGETIVDRSYGGKKAEGVYARDHYQTTNSLLLAPPSGMTLLATQQSAFDTQIRASYLSGMVEPNANLRRGVVKAEMDRQAEKTDAAGDWLAGQSGAFSAFDNSQVSLEGANWTTSVTAGGGWLNSVTGSQNGGVAAIVGQDKTLDTAYAASEKTYAVSWTTAKGVYDLGMLNSRIARLVAEDAALVTYDAEIAAQGADYQSQAEVAASVRDNALVEANGDAGLMDAAWAEFHTAMAVIDAENAAAVAEIEETRDEAFEEADETQQATNAALELAWRTAEADAELARTVAQRNADFDWQQFVIDQNVLYSKAYAQAGKTLADTLAEADADLLSGLGDASEQLTNDSAEEDADEFQRNADADKEARTGTATAQADHRGEDYVQQGVALTPTSEQVPFVCNERTWCPVPTGEFGETTLVEYGQRWTTSSVPAWAQYHAEVANQKATWWDEIGYDDFTLTIGNINNAHDTYTNGTKAAYLDMAEALGVADALWADTVANAGETAVNNISTAEKTYADLLADKTKTYQDLEAEADRDRAIAKAQALRDYKINNDEEAKNVADAAADTAYESVVRPAATAFNIDTAIADGQRQVTVANEELEFSLAGIHADYDAAMTETNSIFDFAIDEADAFELLAHDVADLWKDWKIEDATQLAAAFGNANVPNALAYKAFENATQSMKASDKVNAATQSNQVNRTEATSSNVAKKAVATATKDQQLETKSKARDQGSAKADSNHGKTVAQAGQSLAIATGEAATKDGPEKRTSNSNSELVAPLAPLSLNYVKGEAMDQLVEEGYGRRAKDRRFVTITSVVDHRVLMFIYEESESYYDDGRKATSNYNLRKIHDVSGQVLAHMTDGQLEKYAAHVGSEKGSELLVDLVKGETDVTWQNSGLFVVSILPVGSTATHWADGEYKEAGLSFAGDVLFVVTLGGSALTTGGSRVLLTGAQIAKLNTGFEVGLSAYRLTQGIQANANGESGSQKYGEAFVRLVAAVVAPKVAGKLSKFGNRVAKEIAEEAPEVVAKVSPTAVRSLPGSVAKNTLSGQALRDAEQTTAQLLLLRNAAQANLASGLTKSTSPWIARLNKLSPTDPTYARTYGNALQEEFFTLAIAQQKAGQLPAKMVFNSGVAHKRLDLTNSYNGLRPDVRLSLGNGREAVWDLTTIRQAGDTYGHAAPYAAKGFVDWAIDLPYIR